MIRFDPGPSRGSVDRTILSNTPAAPPDATKSVEDSMALSPTKVSQCYPQPELASPENIVLTHEGENGSKIPKLPAELTRAIFFRVFDDKNAATDKMIGALASLRHEQFLSANHTSADESEEQRVRRESSMEWAAYRADQNLNLEYDEVLHKNDISYKAEIIQQEVSNATRARQEQEYKLVDPDSSGVVFWGRQRHLHGSLDELANNVATNPEKILYAELRKCIVHERIEFSGAEGGEAERIQIRNKYDEQFGTIVKQGKEQIWLAQNFYIESLHNPETFDRAKQEGIIVNVRSLFPEQGTKEQRALNASNSNSSDTD